MGRLGELLVYDMLLKKFASEVEEGAVEIIWMNKDEEIGRPFDIQIITRGNTETVRYIEVKTTLENKDKAFEISSNELKYAFQVGLGYDVYRVGGVGSSDYYWIKYVKDFATYVGGNVAKVYIALMD